MDPREALLRRLLTPVVPHCPMDRFDVIIHNVLTWHRVVSGGRVPTMQIQSSHVSSIEVDGNGRLAFQFASGNPFGFNDVDWYRLIDIMAAVPVVGTPAFPEALTFDAEVVAQAQEAISSQP